jgi:hypothetical protein
MTDTSITQKTWKPISNFRDQMPFINVWSVKREKTKKEIDTYVCPVYTNANANANWIDFNFVFGVIEIAQLNLSGKAVDRDGRLSHNEMSISADGLESARSKPNHSSDNRSAQHVFARGEITRSI